MNDYNAYTSSASSSTWKQNVLATFPSSEMQNNLHHFATYSGNGCNNNNTGYNVANAYDQTSHNGNQLVSDYNVNSIKANGASLQLHHDDPRSLLDIQSRTLGHSESTGLTDSSHTDVIENNDVQLLNSIKSMGSQQNTNNSINNTPLHTNIVLFNP